MRSARSSRARRPIFQVAGGCGLGALSAAKEEEIWGIGVDADQPYLGSFMMTSALKRVNTAVADLTKLAYAGNLATGRLQLQPQERRRRSRLRQQEDLEGGSWQDQGGQGTDRAGKIKVKPMIKF